MPTKSEPYEVISVSLPRELVKRTNALIPRTRRSRVIAEMLATFLNSIERKRLEREYTAYYTHGSARAVQEEHDLLSEWELSDEEAWAILEKEESRVRRASR
jgi:metal-responsive CopG/Arc/MetJ family transcriptional regulator